MIADVVSSDVVGYSTGASITDNQFLSPAFTSVGYNTIDIQDIKISDGGAGSIGWGTENFSIWEGVPTVVDGSYFIYCDPSNDPAGEATDYYWGDDTMSPVSYSIAQGQGVTINCVEADLSITTAGSVPTNKVSFTSIADNNFTGNPFPAAIDIQDIKISDDGAGSIGWGTENFSIWEGVPTVVDGSYFIYCDPSNDPAGEADDYYWGDDTMSPATYEIPSGKGVVINTVDAGLTISITPPYSL